MSNPEYVEVALRQHTRLLHPKLVVLVTSIGKDGRANVMPAAWVMPVSVSPPLVAVAISPRRHTYSLIREAGEFTLSPVEVGMLKLVEETGSTSGSRVDKFAEYGIEIFPALAVKPPCIMGSLACIECRVSAEYPCGDHSIFVGEVRVARVRRGAWKDSTYDLSSVMPLLHLGGEEYATTKTLE
ncbi:MAG: flavin reductase family protein [Thermofilum sp.]|jgi:flavin reductase (DIM6/NTAB) family NADH-FMN oxidoreductase RutF|nr:flavin reductase family protein [Thermofilum sp.]